MKRIIPKILLTMLLLTILGSNRKVFAYRKPDNISDFQIRGLQWIADKQNPDGSLGKNPTNQPALTGLAVLAFLYGGYTPQADRFGINVEKGLMKLIKYADLYQTNLPPPAMENSYFSSEGILTLALVRSFQITQVPMLRQPTEDMVHHIISQNEPYSRWRSRALYEAAVSGIGGLNRDQIPRVVATGKESRNLTNDLLSTAMLLNDLQLSSSNGIERADCREIAERLSKNAKCSWIEHNEDYPLLTWYVCNEAFIGIGGEMCEQWKRNYTAIIPKEQIFMFHVSDWERGCWEVPVTKNHKGQAEKDLWGDGDSDIYATALVIMTLPTIDKCATNCVLLDEIPFPDDVPVKVQFPVPVTVDDILKKRSQMAHSAVQEALRLLDSPEPGKRISACNYLRDLANDVPIDDAAWKLSVVAHNDSYVITRDTEFKGRKGVVSIYPVRDAAAGAYKQHVYRVHVNSIIAGVEGTLAHRLVLAVLKTPHSVEQDLMLMEAGRIRDPVIAEAMKIRPADGGEAVASVKLLETLKGNVMQYIGECVNDPDVSGDVVAELLFQASERTSDLIKAIPNCVAIDEKIVGKTKPGTRDWTRALTRLTACNEINFTCNVAIRTVETTETGSAGWFWSVSTLATLNETNLVHRIAKTTIEKTEPDSSAWNWAVSSLVGSKDTSIIPILIPLLKDSRIRVDSVPVGQVVSWTRKSYVMRTPVYNYLAALTGKPTVAQGWEVGTLDTDNAIEKWIDWWNSSDSQSFRKQHDLLSLGSIHLSDYFVQIFAYSMNSDGTATIIGYRGTNSNVSIPITAFGANVTSIGAGAFLNCSSLTNVTIPNGVTNIGDKAFWGCSSLISATIPSSIIGIGEYAFTDCPNLNDITMPLQIAKIGYDAFSGCSAQTSVTIADGTTSISDSAFGCFGEHNEPMNTILTSISIPSTVNNIGNAAFIECMGLTDIEVNPGNPNFASVDGVLFDKGRTTLIQYPKGRKTTAYSIPNCVTGTVFRAFTGSYLTSVMIPNSVTIIGDETFSGCSALTNVYFQGNAPAAPPNIFRYDKIGTAYYLAGKTGWSTNFCGWPTLQGRF